MEDTLIKHIPPIGGESFVIGVMYVQVMEDGSYTYKRFLYNSIIRRAVNTNLTMLNRK